MRMRVVTYHAIPVYRHCGEFGARLLDVCVCVGFQVVFAWTFSASLFA